MTSASSSSAPFAPRTSTIIGRQSFIQAIRDAIVADDGRAHVLYFVGPGGIGKTRLLEEVEVMQREWSYASFRCTGIIDLYHTSNHSPSGLREAIAEGLDPAGEYFQNYRKQRAEFERKRQEGIFGRELAELRSKLDPTFQEDYAVLAQTTRLVLRFDTLELIQYESDEVQEICQVQDIDTAVKNWLLQQGSRFPNTAILLAGRPQSRIQDDFARGFAQAGRVWQSFDVGTLNAEETSSYLADMVQQRPELAEVLTPEVEDRIYRITSGRPIRLTLLIDLLLQGGSLSRIFPVAENGELVSDETSIDRRLVDHLLNLPEPFGQLIEYLVHARKGLDASVLKHLTGDQWSDDEIKANLALMRGFGFVKPRPGSDELFLHDEVYEMFDYEFKDVPRYGLDINRSLARYYENRSAITTSLEEREDLIVARLYHELQADPQRGYHVYYARWDEEAIKSYETGFDMRLRDEALRFMERYTRKDSRSYSARVADRVDRRVVDRDCAVRWVKRYIARSEFAKARQIAENLRLSQHPAFDWNRIDEPLYKADLLSAWGESLVLLNSPEAEARSYFEQAIDTLAEHTGWDEDKEWWRARILGRAYNMLGYLHRTRGRYGLALQEYKRALRFFENAQIEDDQASTLNNMAYLTALLGRADQAGENIGKALKIRRNLNRQYLIALSYNTRGIIYTLQDHPMWGENECRKALEICENLNIARGIGLICNALGFALRKRGNQWKGEHYTYEEAEGYFSEARKLFQRATEIFSQIAEPLRFWEAYNELGSLYCDWAWLMRHQKDGIQTALDYYQQSIQHQDKAIEIAQKYAMTFQIVDSFDDMAQALGDQSYLMHELGDYSQARKSRTKAEVYFNQVEELVPQAFHLTSETSFGQESDPGETYWLSLGKAHLWRGIWSYRDIEMGVVSGKSEEEKQLNAAAHHLIMAQIYFYKYWPPSFDLRRSQSYFRHFLQEFDVSASWARQQVQSVYDEFRVPVDMLFEAIDDTLG